jgi:hypothetical protein
VYLFYPTQNRGLLTWKWLERFLELVVAVTGALIVTIFACLFQVDKVQSTIIPAISDSKYASVGAMIIVGSVSTFLLLLAILVCFVGTMSCPQKGEGQTPKKFYITTIASSGIAGAGWFGLLTDGLILIIVGYYAFMGTPAPPAGVQPASAVQARVN